MGNIIYGIKRFLKNKNTVTILAILASLGILYWAYYYRIQKATEPVSVPYATKEIAPRTLITSDMVSIRKVPGGVVSEEVATRTSDIVGKYVTNTAVIPAGSLFYKSMLVKWDEMPSSLYADIPDKYTVYLLRVDSESTYGNSIFPGNYIDLYYRTSVNEGGTSKAMIGKFIESIKVLAVTDSSGNNVFETTGNPKNPAYLMFSVSEEYYLLLKKAEKAGGTIFPVPRNENYSKNPCPTSIGSQRIKSHIEAVALEDEIVNSLSNFNNNTSPAVIEESQSNGGAE